MSDQTRIALQAVLAERGRQDEKWGVQTHAPNVWIAILAEELGEVAKSSLENNWTEYQLELIQLAAVAVAAFESFNLMRDGSSEP